MTASGALTAAVVAYLAWELISPGAQRRRMDRAVLPLVAEARMKVALARAGGA